MVNDIKFDGSEFAAGGVRSVSVSVTINGKSLGVDAFVKLEETFEFVELGDENAAILKRAAIADSLAAEALEVVRNTAGSVREAIAARPQGVVQTVPAQQPAPAPAAQAGQTVTGSGPEAIVAVANGATATNLQWGTGPSRFGDADLRFLLSSVYSSEQLEQDVATWLRGKGLNPAAFKVWDNRTGPRGLEAGVAQGSVANVKVDAELVDSGQVPDEFKSVPAARVKFNADGSLYVWPTKQFEGYLKYAPAQGPVHL
jgi:hypothetical protein